MDLDLKFSNIKHNDKAYKPYMFNFEGSEEFEKIDSN